ncbi:Single-stranded DNA-binding protein [Pediococcus pentosaceus ATCC 25745]|uniref:Single-stranded DNA-binding protein n=1 Tax=Pediococcus pentosaceus (strain ATCC 25745 / CCUG 21536 / LMG 10740 / 183-1w) TaxID=278197 RepID=Q03FE5_PEDPA|nr:single-stranded DNA-binding protein [Pediococcus pentosaceus]ABJ68077.1 Single-stranded DNA-binding protein [Pediococcus pentosaceus ATCC 25745]KAF0422875.1 single-stranded DNA-binding protein [Pediococcus pentosaceus]
MRQITISGNIGNDVQVNSTQSGNKVANFNVAVRQNRPDNNGEYGTDWFRCSVWGTRAITVEKFYKKGSHVVVTGSLSINEYNGKTQLQIDVSDFDLPDNRNTNNANSTKRNSNNSFNNGGQSIDISDDQLPF